MIGTKHRTAARQRALHDKRCEQLQFGHPDAQVSLQEAMDKQHRFLLKILREMGVNLP